MYNQICKYYNLGYCKYGNQCRFIHQLHQRDNTTIKACPLSLFEDSSQTHNNNNETEPYADLLENPESFLSLDISSNNKNICKEFLLNKCKDTQCKKIHGYGDRIINVSRILNHESPINFLIKLNEHEFIASDEKHMKIYRIDNKVNCIVTNKVQDTGKITLVKVYNDIIILCKSYYNELTIPSNRIVYAEEIVYSSLIKVILGDKKVDFNLERNYVYDIHYDTRNKLLFVFEYRGIEIYYVSFSDKVFNKTAFMPSTNSIITVTHIQNKLICGLENGYISFLEVKALSPSLLSVSDSKHDDILKETYNIKIHDKRINKIVIKKVNEYTNYLISCSEDLSVKIINIEKGMSVVFTKEFNYEIINIFIIYDYLNNELFCACGEDGIVSVMNNEFDILFDIPPIDSKGNYTRKVKGFYVRRNGFTMLNKNKSEVNGNYFIINNINFIECDIVVNNEYDKNKRNIMDSNRVNFI